MYKPPGPTFNSAPAEQLDPQLGPVANWSFSSLMNFEKCRYQTYLQKVKRIKQESGAAAERGTQIHQMAEDFVSGLTGELPQELKRFEKDLTQLKDLYAEGKVSLEDEWAYTSDWEAEPWKSDKAWARMKLDALVTESKTSCRIIDYKTGRKFGNEFKHSQQGQLYAIGTFFMYPELEYAEVSFWYTDHGQTLDKNYTRGEAMRFLDNWNRRANTMTSCLNFTPAPSKSNCNYCPYSKGRGNGHCEWAEA